MGEFAGVIKFSIFPLLPLFSIPGGASLVFLAGTSEQSSYRQSWTFSLSISSGQDREQTTWDPASSSPLTASSGADFFNVLAFIALTTTFGSFIAVFELVNSSITSRDSLSAFITAVAELKKSMNKLKSLSSSLQSFTRPAMLPRVFPIPYKPRLASRPRGG